MSGVLTGGFYVADVCHFDAGMNVAFKTIDHFGARQN